MKNQFYSYLGMKNFGEKKSTCINTRLKEDKFHLLDKDGVQ